MHGESHRIKIIKNTVGTKTENTAPVGGAQRSGEVMGR